MDMSMPLFVREGTVLPMRGCEDRPDCDYAEQVELHVFGLKAGVRRAISVHDLSGNVQATYSVIRKNGEIRVETDSKKTWRVVEHVAQGGKI